jgi:hypothetical protein
MDVEVISARHICIEGYTPDELLALPDEQIGAWIFTGGPVVFRAGSAEVLGEFAIRGERQVVELAQIEGGGEGVLPALWLLAGRYSSRRGLREVEWIVHAVHCAQPNLKLRRVLERRGFTLWVVPGHGEAFYYSEQLE